ncbi:MAG: response regulator [Prochlorotrichaceae cyanobacterium]|jgi:twitching motility two-component system response regulator PilG
MTALVSPNPEFTVDNLESNSLRVIENLRVRSPKDILLQAASKQFSGRIIISHPHDTDVNWYALMGNGEIHFATISSGQKERISYLMQRFAPDLNAGGYTDLVDWQKKNADYTYLCSRWISGDLNVQQTRQALLFTTLEAISQILAIPSAKVSIENSLDLDPILTSTPVQKLMTLADHRINEWQKYNAVIPSLISRPWIKGSTRFYNALVQRDNTLFVRTLEENLSQDLTFYEIAQRMNLDVFDLVKLLYPLVQEGTIGLKNFHATGDTPALPIAQTKAFKIVCVDDSPTILREISHCLSQSNDDFAVETISDPIKAAMQIVRSKPDIILLDVGMPGMNGYDLCSLLRNHKLFKTTPIVMVTGNTGLIDRARARFVGATDYLTKPFTPSDLLRVVSKHLLETEA